MKKILTSCFVLFLFAKETYSQKEKNAVVENVTKINCLLPGLAHEHALGKASTLYLAAYLDVWLSQTPSYYAGPTSTAHLGGSLDVSLRNYYNHKRRSAKGLRTEMNSMNFVAPVYTLTAVKVPFAVNTTVVHQIGVVWGLQRNYPGRLSLDFNIGAGYLFNAPAFSNNSSIWPMGEFSLGIWLNKKKK